MTQTKLPTITYDDASHKYTIDGEPVPSVTQILDTVTPKEALTWWGMRVGFAAVIELIQRNKLSSMVLGSYSYNDHVTGIPLEGEYVWRGRGKNRKKKTPLEALILDEGLDVNKIKRTKGDLGTAVHNAIETIAATGTLPSLGDYEPELHGYLRALAGFWYEQDPELVEQEIIVASPEHQYAGRFDAIVKFGDERVLLDFKTSKGVYDSMSEQLVLYEVAYLELDGEPFDRKEIVHLKPDAQYQLYPAYTSHETAIASVELFHARQADAKRKPKGWGR